GRLEDAVSLHEKVAADRQRVLGSDHPSTLSSRRELEKTQDAARQNRKCRLLWPGLRHLSVRRGTTSR
ncbi:tetratricopeptide repeat protein, partial [Streptomyces sp. NPDC058440]|uniref:tetratricopeptide repeat protein n=1 Tax=Streptomyces sp. NPDC058440 TaxID=3346501 RepID=UPI00364BEAC2